MAPTEGAHCFALDQGQPDSPEPFCLCFTVKAASAEPDWASMGGCGHDEVAALIYHVMLCVQWLDIKAWEAVGRTGQEEVERNRPTLYISFICPPLAFFFIMYEAPDALYIFVS